jgi:small conductance mechanosensitive channel
MFLPLQLTGVNEEQIAQTDSLVKAQAAEAVTFVKSFAGMTWEQRFDLILDDLLKYGLKLLVAVVIFIVGRWLIKRFSKLLNKIFERRHVDTSLRTFLRSLTEIVLWMVLFYMLIAWLGVDTSLFVAMFAAAGLAIGMAMSGVFQNFAGGVMILLLKPFRTGDWIEAQGQAGTVIDIRLFNTMLRTSDNKTILLPNGGVSTSVINNFNVAGTRRLDFVLPLQLGTDFAAVHDLLEGLLKAEPRLLETPAYQIELTKLSRDMIEVTVYCWVESKDYWSVLYAMNQTIYKTLADSGFEYPSSSLEVMIKNSPKSNL